MTDAFMGGLVLQVAEQAFPPAEGLQKKRKVADVRAAYLPKATGPPSEGSPGVFLYRGEVRIYPGNSPQAQSFSGIKVEGTRTWDRIA